MSTTNRESSTTTDIKLQEPSRYNVVLFNDDYTPMEFVVEMLMKVFNHTEKNAAFIMLEVHENGKGIAGVYNKEIAEQKTNEALYVAEANGFGHFRVRFEKE